MSRITAVMIDSREPDWVKSLKFGGVPVMVTTLETGDVQAVTDDGHTLVIERKTPDDFLNTLKEKRLFPQLARMTEIPNAQRAAGEPVTHWAYLVITGVFTYSHEGKAITDRGVTGWDFSAVMGTILSIEEMGVLVIFSTGDLDYENAVIRLGKRDRKPEMTLLPPRPANILGPKATFLASLPGIGIERVQEILDWAGHNVGHALMGLTDMEIKSPIGLPIRRRVRELLGLQEGENLMIVPNGESIPVQTDLSQLVKGEKQNA